MERPRIQDTPRYLTGLGAAVLAFFFLVNQRTDPTIVTASIFFILACTTDTLQARIPNVLTVGLAVTGVAINIAIANMPGLLDSLLGLSLGFGLLLLPYMMGGFGAGDVKALAALGALVGPQTILHSFIYMALFGGAMAVLHYIFQTNLKNKIKEFWGGLKAAVLTGDLRLMRPEKTEPLRFPYAAAIAFGYFSYIHWGGIL